MLLITCSLQIRYNFSDRKFNLIIKMSRNPKVTMLGDSHVGKTAIIEALINQTFTERNSPTLGACFQRYESEQKNGNKIIMDIWDTAGQEKYRSLLSLYYKSCEGIIIVFDVSNITSLDAVTYWVNQIHSHCDTSPVIILAANKYDLKDTKQIIPESTIQAYADSKKLHLMYCSAKSGYNIKALFQRMFNEITAMQSKKIEKIRQTTKIKQIRKKKRQENSCC